MSRDGRAGGTGDSTTGGHVPQSGDPVTATPGPRRSAQCGCQQWGAQSMGRGAGCTVWGARHAVWGARPTCHALVWFPRVRSGLGAVGSGLGAVGQRWQWEGSPREQLLHSPPMENPRGGRPGRWQRVFLPLSAEEEMSRFSRPGGGHGGGRRSRCITHRPTHPPVSSPSTPQPSRAPRGVEGAWGLAGVGALWLGTLQSPPCSDSSSSSSGSPPVGPGRGAGMGRTPGGPHVSWAP